MRKDELNAAMRRYVKENLSPRKSERSFISSVYAAIREALGVNTCIQIGSYPRRTSVRPLHDLDCLYVAGADVPHNIDPAPVLDDVEQQIKDGFRNPSKYNTAISQQTHSITIKFLDGDEEKFAVDVVPGYAYGQNEFGDDCYLVPEIANKAPSKRQAYYEEMQQSGKPMLWIRSDPRGYISVAVSTDDQNADFRRSVKFSKGWRAACKSQNPNFALKSFHLEQIITEYFITSGDLDIFDAVFRFFCELPEYLEHPRIRDRADPERFIDEYVATLSEKEKALVTQARDWFLIALENVQSPTDVGELFSGGLRQRASSEEAYLFDQGIPVLTEEPLKIQSTVLKKAGFRQRLLDAIGIVEPSRQIKFRVAGTPPKADVFKWKVKNADTSPQPRGEITDHRTRNDPETTKFKGAHYVECYAIKGDICVAKRRQPVVLQRP